MKNNIYKKLNQLIKELRSSGKIRLADILDHRTNKVAWTTSSELFDEIRNILEKEQKTNAAELSENLKDQIKTLLQSIPL